MTDDAPAGYLEFASARGTQLFRVALLMCGDWHEAEYLVQTTLAKVFVAWTRVRRNAEGYARQVMLNTFLSQRRLKRSSELPTTEFRDRPAPGVDADLRMTLLTTLRELPPRYRAVVALRYFEDHSIESAGPRQRVRVLLGNTGTAPRNPGRAMHNAHSPHGSKEVDTVGSAGGVDELEVMVVKPDGSAIQLLVSNGNVDNPGSATITQPSPPGSFAQWSAVADSPAWHL
jgi:DNA-directed RNA polymerase specialized sigma24 family protein